MINVEIYLFYFTCFMYLYFVRIKQFSLRSPMSAFHTIFFQFFFDYFPCRLEFFSEKETQNNNHKYEVVNNLENPKNL